jgi:hypothetical protein
MDQQQLANLILDEVQKFRNDYDYDVPLGNFTDPSLRAVYILVAPIVDRLSRMTPQQMKQFAEENLTYSLISQLREAASRDDYVQLLNDMTREIIYHVLRNAVHPIQAQENPDFSKVFDPYNIFLQTYYDPANQMFSIPQFPYGESEDDAAHTGGVEDLPGVATPGRSGDTGFVANLGQHPVTTGYNEALRDYLEATPPQLREQVRSAVVNYFTNLPGNQPIGFFELFDVLSRL